MLNSRRAAHVVLLAVGITITGHKVSAPTFASDSTCTTYGSGYHCGVDQECVKFWTAEDGTLLCQEWKYYNLHMVVEPVQCVITRGQTSCPSDPK